MPRGLVTLFVAIEALFVVGIGIGVPLVPLLVGWGSANQFQASPLDVWQLAVQAWALGHGTPLQVNLSGAGSIFPAEIAQFDVTLALSGIALLTGLLAIRAGRRIADTEDSLVVGGLLVAIFSTLTGFALWSAQSNTVTVSVTVGTIKIAVPFIVGLLVGWKPWRLFPSGIKAVQNALGDWRDVLVASIRISSGAFLGLAVVASAVLAWSIVAGFTAEIALYEAIHGQVFGGLVITAAQLLLIPTAVVWTMSWLVGPGFSSALELSSTRSPQRSAQFPPCHFSVQFRPTASWAGPHSSRHSSLSLRLRWGSGSELSLSAAFSTQPVRRIS